MAGISSLGIGSGLDIGGLVEQLVAAERAPVQLRLDQKEAVAQAEISAYGALKSKLTALDEALDSLTDISSGRTATSSDDEAVQASAAAGAASGRYAIEVSQLAEAHTLASPAYASLGEVVGSGTLTIEFGTTVYNSTTDAYTGFTANPARAPRTLTIDATNNTIEGIRDAVNAADMGVNAVVVNDGAGKRLVLTSAQGAANSLRITVTNDGGSGLQDLAFNGTATNLRQTIAAQDALLKINGLDVTSSSNDVDEAVEGLTFQLKAQTVGEALVVVNNDDAASIAGVDSFIAAYNSLLEQVRELTKFDPETDRAAVLAGDGTARSIASQLRSALITPIESGDDALRYLVNIGLSSDSNGKLELDTAALTDALNKNFDAVSTMLEGAASALMETVSRFTASDGLIEARTDGLRGRIDIIADQRVRLGKAIERPLHQHLDQAVRVHPLYDGSCVHPAIGVHRARGIWKVHDSV